MNSMLNRSLVAFFLYASYAISANTLDIERTLFGSTLSWHSPSSETKIYRSKKPWTFLVYMAADNDLRAFAANNIRQIAEIGSNQHINLLVHLDIRVENNKKITRRYFVEKGSLEVTNLDDKLSQSMDSGNPATLISAVKWASQYPADNVAVILWNHGTGILDPNLGRIINPAELFTFNPANNKLELDRSVGFLDFLQLMEKNLQDKGICWDTTTGNYLTNEKQRIAFEKICKILNDKVRIVGFDACLMSMIEVCDMFKTWADIMVGSQEVELGSGWNYARVLEPFNERSLTPHEFATHIVAIYGDTYQKITNDYTQSAIDLSALSPITSKLDSLAQLLLSCIMQQERNSVRATLKATRNKQHITQFDEPSYVDLIHWLQNLISHAPRFTLKAGHEHLKKELLKEANELIALLSSSIIANCCGSNLKNAHGLSIYFPERKIHPSYNRTPFVREHSWIAFLHHYLQA